MYPLNQDTYDRRSALGNCYNIYRHIGGIYCPQVLGLKLGEVTV
jgi:hypothetical protein